MTTPKYRDAHIHLQNKMHMYRAVILWISDMRRKHGEDAVFILALDLHWNPLVRLYNENGQDMVDTSAVDRALMEGRDEQLLHCGDCLLTIRTDLLDEFYQLGRDNTFEFGPHDDEQDGPIPEKYKKLFNKSAKEIFEAYPFPEYVYTQGTWPKPQNEEDSNMTNFNIDCLDSLGNFIISQSRFRHTTPELLIAQVLDDWRKGVESGEISSPPSLDMNAPAHRTAHGEHPEIMP